MGDRRQRIERPYCLRCYAKIEPRDGARTVCERCGHVDVAADRRVFWTRERKLVETEQLLKGCIVLLLVGIFVRMVFGPHGFGMGQGWAIGFPIALGTILWQTASKLTRRSPYFRGIWFWTALPLIVAAAFAFLAIALGSSYEEERAGFGMTAAVLVVLALAAAWIGDRFERWKHDRIARAQSN